MKVTQHATQRFLERVLNKARSTTEEFYAAKEELEKIFASVIPGSYGRPFAMPQYKGYVVIHQDNKVITILEKNDTYKKRWRKR